jgi:hypothetical protein
MCATRRKKKKAAIGGFFIFAVCMGLFGDIW